jgi:predicted transcriptional regulator
MATLTIVMDDTQLHRLRQTARLLSVSVEEVVRRSIERFIAHQDRIEQAADFLLQDGHADGHPWLN